MEKTLFSKSIMAIALFFVAIHSLYAMKMELAIPSGQPFGVSRTEVTTDNRVRGAWNVIPVRLVRESNEVGELKVSKNVGEVKKITTNLNPSASVANGGAFVLGRSHDIIEDAQWGEDISMPADVKFVYARFYIQLKTTATMGPDLEDLKEFRLSLPGGTSILTKLIETGTAAVIAPDTVYVIPQSVGKYTIAILGIGITKEPADVGFVKAANPKTVWKPENITSADALKPENIEKVSIPYDLNTLTPISVPTNECFGCAYLNVTATPPEIIDPSRPYIDVLLVNPIGGGRDPIHSTDSTRVILVERILTFGERYYKATENSAITIKFAFSSPTAKEIDLCFEQVPGELGIDVNDGIPATRAIPFVDYSAAYNIDSVIVIKPAGKIGNYITIPAGTKSGTLTLQTLNNGIFALRRSMKIRPGGNSESNELQSGDHGTTSVLVDEIGDYPRTKLLWANPVDTKLNFADTDKLTLRYLNQTDTEFGSTNSYRIIPYDKTVVWVYAISNIANENTMVLPISQKATFNSISGVYQVTFNVNNDSGYTEKNSTVNEIAGLSNQSTKDNLVTLTSEQAGQSVRSPGGAILKVLVRGKPSYFRVKNLNNGAIQQGQNAKFRIELLDEKGSIKNGPRSHDMVFSLVPLSLDSSPLTAIRNVEYTLPEVLTMKAGKSKLLFSIPTKVTPTSKMGLTKSFAFRIDVARYVADSSISVISESINTQFEVPFRTKDANFKTGIWTSVNSLTSEVDQAVAFSTAFVNEAGGAPSVAATISCPKQGEKDRYIYFSIDDGKTWSQSYNVVLTEKPIPVLIRAKSGNSFNKNFSIPIEIKAEEYYKKVTVKYKDFRPLVAPDYTAVIASDNASEVNVHPLGFSTKNATAYATLANIDSAFAWFPLLKPDLYNPQPKNLTDTPSLDSVLGLSNEEYLTLRNVTIAPDSSGSVQFNYGAKNPIGNLGYNNILIEVGGAKLKFASGIPIDIADTGLLPTTIKSISAFYDEPVPMALPKRKKVAISIKKEKSGGRYAVLSKSIKMYNDKARKEWNKVGRNTITGLPLFQRNAVKLSFEYIDLYGKHTATFYKYLTLPVIESIQTWSDVVIVNKKVNPLHCGSIIKIKGQYFGKSPKVWIESSENGVTSIPVVNCKVLSTEIDETSPETSTIFVQMPKKLPTSWDYLSSEVSLVINSGTGLGGRNILLFAPSFSGDVPGVNGPINQPPVCLNDVIVDTVLYTNKTPIEIPVIGEPINSISGAISLASDLNSDQLQITKAWVSPESINKGTIKIQKDPKTGYESIVFVLTSGTPERGSIVKIFFEVKETYQSKSLVQAYQGSFIIKFNP